MASFALELLPNLGKHILSQTKVLLPDDGAEDDCIAILGSHDDQAWIAVEEDPHVPEGAGEDIF